ncbi:MAG: hypothetical protein K8T89_11880, partial [Planctomycetes bacterium]|nr:hypothetical protein [Planctomycetota bacterium]
KLDEVIRIDLFSKDSTRASEMLQAVLKARGQQIVVDAMVQDRLKKKLKGEYIFYTETLTADEIAQVLEQLGAEDRKLEQKKAGDGQFDKFMLAPFLAADLTELGKILGIPPAQIKLPKPKTMSVIDPRKSLESITAQQLATSLPKSGSRGNEKQTLLLPFGVASHAPQNSPFSDRPEVCRHERSKPQTANNPLSRPRSALPD